MNKKERTILAKLVAEMKYSNSSTLQLIDYADRILREFPVLKGTMPSEVNGVLEDNIVENMGIYLRQHNNPLALEKYENKNMNRKWKDTKYLILWDYLEEENITLECLDDLIDDYEGFKRVVTSHNWKYAVKCNCEDNEFLGWCTKLM